MLKGISKYLLALARSLSQDKKQKGTQSIHFVLLSSLGEISRGEDGEYTCEVSTEQSQSAWQKFITML